MKEPLGDIMKALTLLNIKNMSLALILSISIFGLTACASPEDKAKSYLENGMQLLEEGELAKANIEFRNALQLDRTLTKAIWGQALVAEQQGNHIKHFKLLNAVLLNEPENLEALVKTGRIFLLAGQLDKALEKSDAAMKIEPENLSALSLRASVLFKLDNKEGAVKLAKTIIAKDPDYVDALIVLAIERLDAKDAEKAIKYLDQGLKNNEKNVALQLIKIKALNSLSKLDLAEGVYKRLIDFYPKVPSFNYSLAQFYLKQDRKDDAENEFRKVIKNNPDDIKAKLKLIQLLNVTKNTDTAKKQLIEFVNNEPTNYDLKFALVQFYISSKQLNLASETLSSITSSAADNEIVVKAMGVEAGLLLAKGQKDSAEKVITDILAKDSRNETGLILKSNINIDRQQYDAAISDLRIVLRDTPNSSRALFYLAKAHLLSGSPELADEQYLKAFKSSRFNAEYGLTYANFLLKRNQPSRAEKILQNILEKSPGHIPTMQILARTRLNLGDWIGAQQVADQIVRAGDKSNAAAQIQSAILAGKKDYDESISLLKRTYESTPGKIEPVVALVRTYLLAGKPVEAGNFLDATIKASPSNINARILRGQVYASQGQIDQAIATYQKAIELDPNNTAGHYNLAVSYIRNKEYDKANTALGNGLSAAPENFLLRLTRAGVYEQLGKTNEAITLYEGLVKERPDADIVANNLSSLLTENRTDKESLDKAYTLSQRFKRSEIPQFKDTFGWASYKVGKYSEAESLLKSAAEGLPNLPIIQYHLGMTYLAKENKALARKSLENALKLAGDKPFAQADEIRAVLEKL